MHAWFTSWLSGCSGGTYRDKNAMRVLGLAGVVCTHEVGQALDVIHAHHVDVVVKAESLDEREVDLKSDVALVLLVGGEDAESHAVWITAGRTGRTVKNYSFTLMLKIVFQLFKMTFCKIAILTHSWL